MVFSYKKLAIGSQPLLFQHHAALDQPNEKEVNGIFLKSRVLIRITNKKINLLSKGHST